MHGTAFRIGTLAMNIYADLPTASILEVGSRAFNGSLRDSALPTTTYVGLDVEEGEGVDAVIVDGVMPVDDAAFDLVIASSVFEHDPAFWQTFVDMARKTRDGGYIYLNAPSNGSFHRYPQDNWRFYPDAGAALVKWSVSQGQQVNLVESFVADRDGDIWNDFVAVFRKGPITRKLPDTFLHEHVPCRNIRSWKTPGLGNGQDSSEDMMLLAEAQVGRDAMAGEIQTLRAQASAAEDQWQRRRAELEQAAADAIARLGTEQDRLVCAERSAAEWRDLYDRQVAENRLERDAHERLTRDLERRGDDRLAALRLEADEQVAQLKATLARAEASQREADGAARAIEAKLSVRFEEIATLTTLLRQEQGRRESAVDQAAWLRTLLQAHKSTPKWWRFVPRAWSLKRERNLLKRRGIFDAMAYLHHNPDVSAAGLDPLEHYLLHGMSEGRARSF